MRDLQTHLGTVVNCNNRPPLVRRLTLRTLLVPVVLCVTPHSTRTPLAAQGPSDSTRIDRLLALAQLDGAVHYFHPEVAVHSQRWDSLFAEHVIPIADAPTVGAYREALGELLTRLDDPATHVVGEGPASWTTESYPNGVVVLRPTTRADRTASLEAAIQRAQLLVVDFRGATPELPESYLARLLLPHSAAASAQRTLRYSAFPFPELNGRQVYHRAWEVRTGETFEGGEGRRVAFLVDEQTAVPALALALRSTGHGAVVGVGTPRVRAVAHTYRVRMGDGVSVDVRVGQRMVDTLEAGLPVDTTVLSAENALEAAIRWASRPVQPWPEATWDSTGVVPVPRAPRTGPWSESHPPQEYRLLAAARLWNTLQLFFPYKAEMGDDLNTAFRATLPQIEHAPDSLAFVQGLAAFAAHIHDSHMRVWKDTEPFAPYTTGLAPVFGDAYPPVVVQFVEGQLTVIRIVDPSAARAGLAVGDVITTIDGESTPDRAARLSPFLGASTPQALKARLASVILAAHDSTPARLTIVPTWGGERSVLIQRSLAYRPDPSRPYGLTSRDGPVVQVLPGNIGYIDLERIPDAMVDSAFITLRNARGIVFDARGFPGGSFRIPRLLSSLRDSTIVARFERIVVRSPDATQNEIQASTQVFEPVDGPHYSGRTAVLIDERAISNAEHVGLLFETLGRPIFVGSPTTGSNGAWTFLQLPGSIRVSFTGARARHADGRPLQRVGLQPDIPVAPTIAGVRSGRDEVLERAVSCLTDDLCFVPNVH